MRIRKIEINGKTNEHIAVIVREPRAAIEAYVTTPKQNFHATTDATDRDDQWRLAEQIQAALDEVRGCGGDIREYFYLIEYFAD